ncbi:MAG: signal peptidase I [Solirubrobacteraceae bacterium]
MRDSGGVAQAPKLGGGGPPVVKKEKSTGAKLFELVVIVAVAVGLAFLIQAFVVKPYKIPSGSMEPTLAIGQRVLVDRIGNDFAAPSIGAITVFHPPEGAREGRCGPNGGSVTPGGAACDSTNPHESSETYIKRVVAGPGDWLYVKAGHVYLSTTGKSGPFKREKDSYIMACGNAPECNFPVPIHVPPNHWFMMGDHRGNSEDSRFWGPVPRSSIIGEAFATYWPPDRIGFF